MSQTSTFSFPFVNLKFRFCDSPSFLSSDFSAAEHPSSRLVSPQWRGQWYLMDSQLEGEYGRHICLVACAWWLAGASYGRVPFRRSSKASGILWAIGHHRPPGNGRGGGALPPDAGNNRLRSRLPVETGARPALRVSRAYPGGLIAPRKGGLESPHPQGPGGTPAQ